MSTKAYLRWKEGRVQRALFFYMRDELVVKSLKTKLYF